MSSVFPNSFYHNNTTAGNQLINESMPFGKPCPPVAPVVVTYFQGSPIGWNAVLVGLLSSILAIIFLLTCLYYLIRRRRFLHDESEIPSQVALIDKKGGSSIPVTNSSQTATTTFINEPGKETKISTFTEQGSNPTVNGDFVGMPTMGNGHMGSSSTNGLLANGNADPSELRLLQHEHH